MSEPQGVWTPPTKTLGVASDLFHVFRWALEEYHPHTGTSAHEPVSIVEPADDVVFLAMAKSALETGNWLKMFNFNFGNVKAGSRWLGMYTCIQLNEKLDGKYVWFAPGGQLKNGPGSPIVGQIWDIPPGHPQTRMRAFANRYDGAESYVAALRQLFPRSYEALKTGDPKAFVGSLKAERYFTADEAPYFKAVDAIFRQLRTKHVPMVLDPQDGFAALDCCDHQIIYRLQEDFWENNA